MKKQIPAALLTVLGAHAGFAFAESNTQLNLPEYTYNSMGASITVGAEISELANEFEDDGGDNSIPEVDGFVLKGEFNREINEKYFALGDLILAEYEDNDFEVSKMRLGIGLGYFKPLSGGEASLNFGAKLYYQSEDIDTPMGDDDEGDIGYGIFVGIRHKWSNDILDLDLGGEWEGFATLERQKFEHIKNINFDFGMRYFYNETTAFEAVYHFGDDNLYGDGSLLSSDMLNQISFGIHHTY